MDLEIDDICEKIIDVAANAGKIFKSPESQSASEIYASRTRCRERQTGARDKISLKRDFLRLILSDFFTD